MSKVGMFSGVDAARQIQKYVSNIRSLCRCRVRFNFAPRCSLGRIFERDAPMTKAKGNSRKREYEHFVFEIREWEPEYSFSVNLRGDQPGNYSEFVEINFDGACIEPSRFAGAATHFILSSRRRCFPDDAKLLRLDERQKWLGELCLSPKKGSYYGPIPHESMATIISALSSKRFGYVILRGGPLRRGSSWCESIDLTSRWQ
jgi:hypothetical protein